MKDLMNPFEKSVHGLVRYMYYVAGAAIVAMMLLTCLDILLRLAVTLYVRWGWGFLASLQPVPGTYELVCFLGSAAAAFAMAHTTVESGHVAVSILVDTLSPKIQAAVAVGTGTLGFVFFGLLAWQSILYANKLKRWGEVSMTLELPYYPFIYGVAVASVAVCLVLLITVTKESRKVVSS